MNTQNTPCCCQWSAEIEPERTSIRLAIEEGLIEKMTVVLGFQGVLFIISHPFSLVHHNSLLVFRRS